MTVEKIIYLCCVIVLAICVIIGLVLSGKGFAANKKKLIIIGEILIAISIPFAILLMRLFVK